MHEQTFFWGLVWIFLAVAVVTFPVLFFVTAPYGRHRGQARGPTLNSTLGWLVMEAPSSIGFFLCWLVAGMPADPASIAFLLLWQMHYFHRAFVFPFRRRGGEKEMPLQVAASAFCFTSINSYLNGRYLFTFAPAGAYGADWQGDPRFIVGALLFLAGFAINQHSDQILFNLRKPGETGYKIPRGGLYRWISCPNYLGEMIEWTGWAILTWSIPGLVFALWTVANLLPRARANHRWYQEKFPDYPPERGALLPGRWSV